MDNGYKFQKLLKARDIHSIVEIVILHWQDKRYHISIIGGVISFGDNMGLKFEITRHHYNLIKKSLPRLINFRLEKYVFSERVEYLVSEEFKEMMNIDDNIYKITILNKEDKDDRII